ncbi:MAG: TetR/AcrR family transcriptional regulator [Idiomarina sp.]|nr:TetR/AcrR family transcriptional regulator [Idiomarina sp.]
MTNTLSRDDILNAALQLGDVTGWEKLTLNQVARQLDTSLADIHREFPQKDDLVDAWLDRADSMMLARFPHAGSNNKMSNEQRLRIAMQKWLDALAPHHKLTGDMLLYKLEPGHIHLQTAGLLRISRTVQWFREAAELKATHVQRIGQEIALSSLFIGVFIHWLNDKTPNQRKTRDRLHHVLHSGNRLNLWR